MTPIATSSTTLDRTNTKSESIKLSDKDRKKGIEILLALQTVDRAMRLNDDIPLVVTNILRNEGARPEFVAYIRKVAGFEVPDQRRYLEHLLFLCYEQE